MSPSPGVAPVVYICKNNHTQENLPGQCTVCRCPVEKKADVDKRIATGMTGVLWSTLGGVYVAPSRPEGPVPGPGTSVPLGGPYRG